MISSILSRGLTEALGAALLVGGLALVGWALGWLNRRGFDVGDVLLWGAGGAAVAGAAGFIGTPAERLLAHDYRQAWICAAVGAVLAGWMPARRSWRKWRQRGR